MARDKNSRRGRNTVLLWIGGLLIFASISILALNLFVPEIQYNNRPPVTYKATESDMVPLGIRLSHSGQIELFTPECPNVTVTAVQWTSFELRRPVAWSIKHIAGRTSSLDFTVGRTPPGYKTTTALIVPDDTAYPEKQPQQFIAVRRDADGTELRASGINIRLDELPIDRVIFRAPDESLHEVESGLAFRQQVGCPNG